MLFPAASIPGLGPILSPVRWVLCAASPRINQPVPVDDRSLSSRVSVKVREAIAYLLSPYTVML